MPYKLISATLIQDASDFEDEQIREHLQGLLDTDEANGWVLSSLIPQYELHDEDGNKQGLCGPYLVMHKPDGNRLVTGL